MMLGRASRYIPLSPEHVRNGDPNHDAESAGREQTAQEKYDWCVRQGNCDYEKRVHCLIYPNCNHHVAHCLSCMSYRGWNHYGMITLWFWIFFAGTNTLVSTAQHSTAQHRTAQHRLTHSTVQTTAQTTAQWSRVPKYSNCSAASYLVLWLFGIHNAQCTHVL